MRGPRLGVDRWRARAVATLLGITLAAAARAGTAPSRTQVLLLDRPSRESLRTSLLAYADSIQPTRPEFAGEALYSAGASFSRASMRDSAIACYRRAIATRGSDEERLAWVDALLLRRRDGDLELALEMLEEAEDPSRGEFSMSPDAYKARLAWAELLAGRTQKAYDLFRSIETVLDLDPVWGYRMARAFVEQGDMKRALAALQPLAIASREQDEEIMSLATRAFARFGDQGRLEAALSRSIAARDKSEGTMIVAMGGRRVRFRAADGFALGGVVAHGDERLRRAAIVLCAPGDTLESYDSLTVALGRAGWAVMLMEMRGSGWSAAPTCPFHDAWVGREDEMQSTSAADVSEALRALSLAAKIDTSRYVLAGIGSTAPIAVEAAEMDDRVPALLLLSPVAAPTDRGTLRAHVGTLKRPIYFSNAPEDFLNFEVTEALYQAGDRARSRVGDVSAAGSGARPFRRDAAALKRLIAWLDETVPARAPAGAKGSGSKRAK